MFKLNIFLVLALVLCLIVGNVMSDSCPCAATADLNYVCGSNRVTYDNEAILGCYNQCEGKNIYVAHSGRCT